MQRLLTLCLCTLLLLSTITEAKKLGRAGSSILKPRESRRCSSLKDGTLAAQCQTCLGTAARPRMCHMCIKAFNSTKQQQPVGALKTKEQVAGLCFTCAMKAAREEFSATCSSLCTNATLVANTAEAGMCSDCFSKASPFNRNACRDCMTKTSGEARTQCLQCSQDATSGAAAAKCVTCSQVKDVKDRQKCLASPLKAKSSTTARMALSDKLGSSGGPKKGLSRTASAWLKAKAHVASGLASTIPMPKPKAWRAQRGSHVSKAQKEAPNA